MTNSSKPAASKPASGKPAKPKARKPLMSRVPADFVRAVLKGHSGLGLAFAAIIYLVCLTGSIAVFAHEFQRWEHSGTPALASASPEAAQTALEAAMARAGGGEHGYIQMPNADVPHFVVTVEKDGVNTSWLADAGGRLVGEAEYPWTEFITRLHINLHLPQTWGVFLVGLTGVALLSSLISGILAHPRIFRDAFHLRLGGSKRLQEADLHNRLGVWALPFHVIVSLTGALLGLTTLIVGVLGMALFQGDTNKVYELFLPATPKDDPRPAPILNLVPMFEQVREVAPGGRIDLVMLEHPAEMGGAAMFNVVREEGRLANTDAYAFDRTGKRYHSQKSADNNLGENILNSLGKLHFGWFGGGLVKIAYALLGLGLTYLAASGVTIWLARRRDKRNAAPGWERAWTGTVWGQPVALALPALLVAIAGPSIPVNILIASWCAVTVIAIAASALVAPANLAKWLKLLTAGVLAATGALHLLLRPGGDAVIWSIDLVLLASGIALGRWAVTNSPVETKAA